MRTEIRALLILRDIWQRVKDSPYYDIYGNERCFFCGQAPWERERHKDDCSWIAMKKLFSDEEVASD